MTTATTAKPVAAKKPAVPEVVKTFQQMAAAIPAGGEDTGQLSILTQLAAATEPQGLSAPWETTGTTALFGKVLVVTDLKRMPSEYEDGLGFYLVVNGAIEETGEAMTFTTGSVSVAAQLVKAFDAGWLPIKCEIVESTRPTKSGYKPQHLRVYGREGDF